MTLQHFLYALVPLADTVMLVTLDQDAMSSVALSTQVAFVKDLFIFAIMSGTSMLAAQYWGKNDVGSIEKVFAYALKLTLPIAFIFFIVTFIWPSSVIRIYSDVPGIIEYGTSYLRIASFSYIFLSLASLESTVMKNVGQVKEATAISIIMVFMNVGLNGVFIYGLFGFPGMGTAGAALATTVSAFSGYVMCVAVRLHKRLIRLRIQNILKTPKDIYSRYNKHTFPVLLNQIGWGLGFTMISVIMGHLGTDAVAANSFVAVVKDLISCFCFALCTGGSIIVGNELGAGRLEEAKQYVHKLCMLAFWSGIIAGILILASAPFIVYILKNHNDGFTPEAADYLFWMLVMCVYYMVGRSMNSIVIGGIFVAGGDTKFGFICDTLTMWSFIVPVGAFAAFILDLPVLAVFFILNLDEIIKLPAVYIHYRKYKWVKNLIDL